MWSTIQFVDISLLCYSQLINNSSGLNKCNHDAMTLAKFGVVSWCTGTQREGNNHCTPFFTNLCLAVGHCWVFCIGSCKPVHEDRTKLGISVDFYDFISLFSPY